MTAPSGGPADAALQRRLLSLIYETLILAALLLLGALPMVMLTRNWDPAMARLLLQIWLLVLCGAFYAWQWAGTGQTLPMKTWRLKVVTRNGAPLTVAHALWRYALASVSILMLGLGFVWALVDRDRRFLHDRLAGTQITVSGDAPPSA